MPNQKPKTSDWSVLKRILSLAYPYRLLFIIATALAFVLAPLGSIRPYLINLAVDDYIINLDMQGLIRITFFLCLLLVVEVILRYIFIYSTNWIGQKVIMDLRSKVFKHIVSLRMSYFDKTAVGTSTTRTINDIESINQVFSQGVITIMADILSIIWVLVLMTMTSVRLTLICMITMPLMMIATYIFKEKVKISFQKVRTQISKMNAFLNERLSGMTIIKVFNAGDREMAKFSAINREYTGANLRSILYYALFYPAVEVISALSLALMIWWGAKGVLENVVSFGALVAFPLYITRLFRPLRMLADRFNTLQMGMVAGDRVFRLLDTNDKIEDLGTKIATKVNGHINFENVSFSYDDENPVLKNISLEILPGQTLAVVGSTGSGKTTLINVLNRFYEHQIGRILIDGVDIKDYKLSSIRERIGTVLQDVFLFSGTILDNLRLNDESVSEQTVIEASKVIRAHEFITQLPGGYHFQLAERGANLSLGQRQLLSFIRFLVFNPDIMILDEATSSIDPETEALIQFAIEKLIEKRSSIIIAHRLSTIRHADKIAVLDKGELVEFGSHEELLEIDNGYYKKLYDHQFVEVAP